MTATLWLPVLAGAPVFGLLQQVNHKLRLAQVFGRSWSAREARESPTPLGGQGVDSLHPLGGIAPLTSQLPLADGSLGMQTLGGKHAWSLQNHTTIFVLNFRDNVDISTVPRDLT